MRFGKFIELDISRGETITIATTKKGLKEADALKPKSPGRAKPRAMRFADGSVTWLGKPFFEPYAGPKKILKKASAIHP
jgi:hypothetical protein